LFESSSVSCANCHSSKFFTNLQSYDVGTAGPTDPSTGVYDTPTLVELWRTAPYLHDGSARTIREVLTRRNANDQHGKTSQLNETQIDDLANYVLSL
jgi:cytochrome c peroxidase